MTGLLPSKGRIVIRSIEVRSRAHLRSHVREKVSAYLTVAIWLLNINLTPGTRVIVLFLGTRNDLLYLNRFWQLTNVEHTDAPR